MDKGEIDLKSFSKSIIRRHADLFKTPDGKTDGNSSKKGNTKNRKSVADIRETPQPVSVENLKQLCLTVVFESIFKLCH